MCGARRRRCPQCVAQAPGHHRPGHHRQRRLRSARWALRSRWLPQPQRPHRCALPLLCRCGGAGRVGGLSRHRHARRRCYPALVNAAVLNALGLRGVVVNIARGSVIDTTALAAALREAALPLRAWTCTRANPPRPSCWTWTTWCSPPCGGLVARGGAELGGPLHGKRPPPPGGRSTCDAAMSIKSAFSALLTSAKQLMKSIAFALDFAGSTQGQHDAGPGRPAAAPARLCRCPPMAAVPHAQEPGHGADGGGGRAAGAVPVAHARGIATAFTADPAQKERVGEEMADVLLYLLQLADHTGVDLRDAVERKLVKNAIKHWRRPLARLRPMDHKPGCARSGVFGYPGPAAAGVVALLPVAPARRPMPGLKVLIRVQRLVETRQRGFGHVEVAHVVLGGGIRWRRSSSSSTCGAPWPADSRPFSRCSPGGTHGRRSGRSRALCTTSRSTSLRQLLHPFAVVAAQGDVQRHDVFDLAAVHLAVADGGPAMAKRCRKACGLRRHRTSNQPPGCCSQSARSGRRGWLPPGRSIRAPAGGARTGRATAHAPGQVAGQQARYGLDGVVHKAAHPRGVQRTHPTGF